MRGFNIFDDFNREILNIIIETNLLSATVVSKLEELIDWRVKPEKIRIDNSPEFISEKLKGWCDKNEIALHYVQPEKPTQNSLLERFNRTFRTEFLDVYYLRTSGR